MAQQLELVLPESPATQQRPSTVSVELREIRSICESRTRGGSTGWKRIRREVDSGVYICLGEAMTAAVSGVGVTPVGACGRGRRRSRARLRLLRWDSVSCVLVERRSLGWDVRLAWSGLLTRLALVG